MPLSTSSCSVVEGLGSPAGYIYVGFVVPLSTSSFSVVEGLGSPK